MPLNISVRVGCHLTYETPVPTPALFVLNPRPGHGWRGLDPTHNRQIGETYVKIGHGQDYSDVPPISGNTRNGAQKRKKTVAVKITAVI